MSELNDTDAWQILDLVATTQDATIQLFDSCVNEDKTTFEILTDDVLAVYRTIMQIIKNSTASKSLFLDCECIEDSIKRAASLFSHNLADCAKKIEFEVLPLIQAFYTNFYFYEIASKNETLLKSYYEQDRFKLGGNEYIDKAEEAGEYKYELSIVVIGYNKLEYTMMCVESLLKNIPEGLNYELILLNHGSSDGTKEFFESVKPHKQLDIYRNGGASGAFTKIIEGKYALFISNDVLITENAIKNMMACIKSDSKIVFVVPTTPNVSNLQEIYSNYKNESEMYAFASKNNQTNPLKWEQRTRLCNPVSLVSSKDMYSSTGIQYETYKLSLDMNLFPDDRLSYFIRKRGQKMMLAKDAFCHHFGSITLMDEITTDDYYTNGRAVFRNAFGIDPWGKGFCYDPVLLEDQIIQKKDNVNILGVSPGMGSNPLKIKTLLIEQGSENINLFLVTEEEHFKPDYEAYTEPSRIEITPVSKFTSVFPEEKFDYITVETSVSPSVVDTFKKRLCSDGKLLVQCSDQQTANLLQSTKPKMTISSTVGIWCIYE